MQKCLEKQTKKFDTLRRLNALSIGRLLQVGKRKRGFFHELESVLSLSRVQQRRWQLVSHELDEVLCVQAWMVHMPLKALRLPKLELWPKSVRSLMSICTSEKVSETNIFAGSRESWPFASQLELWHLENQTSSAGGTDSWVSINTNNLRSFATSVSMIRT